MKKYFILLLSVFIALTLNSCTPKDDPVSPTKTSFWKKNDIVINWQHRDSSNQYGNWEEINGIPNGTWIINGQWGAMTYGLLGTYNNLTCTYKESWAGGNNITTNFAWDPLPSTMNADTLYNVAAEVKGGNGSINITNFYKASEICNDWSVATDDHMGKTYGKVKGSKPIDVTKPDQMAIRVVFTSYYAVFQFTYIYEWVTE
jgi:hypothetical protein